MKKLILGAVMLIGFISFSTAQKVADSEAKKHTAKKVAATRPVTSVAAPKAATSTAPGAKPVAATAPKSATSQPVVLKKDGTPDKRYSKTTAKGTGPLKKDSTPDKRYKANKKP